jgi:hypothetical protein
MPRDLNSAGIVLHLMIGAMLFVISRMCSNTFGQSLRVF